LFAALVKTCTASVRVNNFINIKVAAYSINIGMLYTFNNINIPDKKQAYFRNFLHLIHRKQNILGTGYVHLLICLLSLSAAFSKKEPYVMLLLKTSK
jgi:hypothetical protein